MGNKKKRDRRPAKKSPAAIEISKVIEMPGGEILEVNGEGYLIKAPKGTDMATIDKAVREFLLSKRNARE